IDFNAGGAAEIIRVVAAFVLALVPNLQQKLPRSRELQKLRILLTTTTNPHRVAIDVDAVFEIGPLIPLTCSAPRREAIACLIEFQRGRRSAPDRARFIGLQR